jgi:hypothetical protein
LTRLLGPPFLDLKPATYLSLSLTRLPALYLEQRGSQDMLMGLTKLMTVSLDLRLYGHLDADLRQSRLPTCFLEGTILLLLDLKNPCTFNLLSEINYTGCGSVFICTAPSHRDPGLASLSNVERKQAGFLSVFQIRISFIRIRIQPEHPMRIQSQALIKIAASNEYGTRIGAI